MNLSRRKFLSTSTKSAIAISVLRSPLSAFAQSAAVQPVFARLDEYIARHMRETGAPGLTLALANRDGLIRVSTYGYADTKAGLGIGPENVFRHGLNPKFIPQPPAVTVARGGKPRSKKADSRVSAVAQD